MPVTVGRFAFLSMAATYTVCGLGFLFWVYFLSSACFYQTRVIERTTTYLQMEGGPVEDMLGQECMDGIIGVR